MTRLNALEPANAVTSEHIPEPALSEAEGLARTTRSRTWATGLYNERKGGPASSRLNSGSPLRFAITEQRLVDGPLSLKVLCVALAFEITNDFAEYV